MHIYMYVCKCVSVCLCVYIRDASFIIIMEICTITLSRETKEKLLKQRNKFWIMKIETLKP